MPNADKPQALLPILCAGILAIGIGAAVWVNISKGKPEPAAPQATAPPAGAISPELLAELASIEERERGLDETLWAKERLAQRCGEVIEYLWDSLNQSSNQLQTLSNLRFDDIIVSRYGTAEEKAHGIQFWRPEGGTVRHGQANFQAFIQDSGKDGWELVMTEFRHQRFETDEAGQPKSSVFYCAGHLMNPAMEALAVIEGDVAVEWRPAPDNSLPTIRTVDASGLTAKLRRGTPPFRLVVDEAIQPLPRSYFIDPLILYDLDDDGIPEMVLAARNLRIGRLPSGQFASRPLCEHPPGLIFTGIISDFDGNQTPDFICAKFDGLEIFRGNRQGEFNRPGEIAWKAEPRLRYGQTLTCGDIDNDGDLDLWLGQYKGPYDQGQMPTPFYDANDGNPSYLLLNDGKANFTDITKERGLGPKQLRRAYGGSFVDTDSDGDLDLIVVADFCGADLYINDGSGSFVDATMERISDPRAFGMGHALTDINSDGALDFLMIGMNSPTVDRLRHLGLSHPSAKNYQEMFARMTYGNRLYFGDGQGRFSSAPMNDQIARSGWAWGAAAADFDNDGWPDIYIANGHNTARWVRDYEPEFWLHDIYVGNSSENPAAHQYFKSKISGFKRDGLSYGGFERNRFYLSEQGKAFFDSAHLFGTSLGEDSRNAASADLDGDGKLELLVTTFELEPEALQTLKVFRNELPQTGNWIGLRFSGSASLAVGARVEAFYGGRRAVRHIVSGDSYRTQHPLAAHFGLGGAQKADRIEIVWVGGRKTVIEHPLVNQWHRIQTPSTNGGGQ